MSADWQWMSGRTVHDGIFVHKINGGMLRVVVQRERGNHEFNSGAIECGTIELPADKAKEFLSWLSEALQR